MNVEILRHITESFFRLTSIPGRIYHQDQLAESYPSSAHISLTEYDAALIRTPQRAALSLHPLHLAFGRLVCKDSCYSVIFGPVKVLPVTNEMLHNYFIEHDLQPSDMDRLRKQLDSLINMNLDYFADILASVYCSINHEIIYAKELLGQLPLETASVSKDVHTHLLSDQEAFMFGDVPLRNTYAYEQEMLYYVKNGMVEELSGMDEVNDDIHINAPSSDSIRYYKNLLLAQNTLFSRAVIEGGVAPDAAFSMSDFFVMQIEKCETIFQLNQIYRMLCNDYCKSVRDIKSPQTEDVIVNKAIQYIIEHMNENISAQQIAEHLDISREYLSGKFKKTMGVSIPTFINSAKIDIAKRLLRFSNKSLVAISNYLSYSSQSYFQTQFKKLTGMTPMEYRQANRQ